MLFKKRKEMLFFDSYLGASGDDGCISRHVNGYVIQGRPRYDRCLLVPLEQSKNIIRKANCGKKSCKSFHLSGMPPTPFRFYGTIMRELQLLNDPACGPSGWI